ncbi:MAG TPA: Gmad2 immunoglobulin-like domain-containing protein [Thermoanaerobaculia bacterium]|nr:Gmad2 immunoglobulin-like domain-containing protein [Thermoanaerobaculia bacterium]
MRPPLQLLLSAITLFLLCLSGCSRPSDSPDATTPSVSTAGTGAAGKASTPPPSSVTPDDLAPDPTDSPLANVILDVPSEGVAVRSNPIRVAGRARTFENHVGIRIESASGDVIERAFATATGELGSFNPFEAEVLITRDPGNRIRIVIFEESAKDGSIRSSDSAVVSFLVPTRDVRLFFPTSGTDCTRVQPFVRTIPSSISAARLTAEALLDGPTATEAARGAHAPFPPGSGIRSVNLRGGVLTIDFNERLSNVGGSCRAQAIRASVEATLKAIDGVDRVVITAMGNEDQALQP